MSEELGTTVRLRQLVVEFGIEGHYFDRLGRGRVCCCNLPRIVTVSEPRPDRMFRRCIWLQTQRTGEKWVSKMVVSTKMASRSCKIGSRWPWRCWAARLMMSLMVVVGGTSKRWSLHGPQSSGLKATRT